MTTQKQHTNKSLLTLKILGCLILLFLLAVPALAQNTKGDKPVRNQRQVRETKSKSVRKKSQGKTKDLAGRRLRTKNKSSANRANSSYTQSSPTFKSKRKSGSDRASVPRGRTFSTSPREGRSRAQTGDISGHRIRTRKPSRNDAARSNVYPQNGAYVNNPSRKPRDKKPKTYTRTASGKPIINRSPQQKQRAWRGNIRGGGIGSPSATGSVSNVYPQTGDYSRYATKSPRKQKPKVYSNVGVPGRTRISANGTRRKFSIIPRSITRPFVKGGRKNVYWGKYSKGEKPFLSDLSGNPLRTRNFRSTPAGLLGRDTLRMFGRKPGGDRAYRGKRGGFISATPVSGRAWKGDLAGRKVRSPRAGRKTETAGSFVFPRKMSISTSGQVGRKLQGGGYSSRSNGRRDNRPLPAKQPGIGASGIIKSMARTNGRRPIRGGGSVSGGGWNNKGVPINVRNPGAGSMRAGNFSGNIKSQRPLKGGGSVSGLTWNNKQTPISVRQPGSGTMRAGNFSGNIKARRPEKGGGSVSGRIWNNKETPISVRPPGSGTMKAGNFSGNIKARRPEKGGGSVSGQIWNNKEKPIIVRTPDEEGRVVGYSGKIKIRKGYVQNPNANEASIKKKKPDETTYLVAGLQVKIKQSKYEKKPNAAEGSLPGIGPKEGTVKASKYAGDVKLARNYKHNPRSHKDALDGIPPTSASVKASEYSSSMKMYWKYKHAPLGSEDALKVRAPNKAYARIGEYQGNIKMRKFNDHRLHPDAQFAHRNRGNIKEDRTILMDVKLLWAKLFKKSDTQPTNVKDNPLRPRYDKSEKGLWADDPSYTKKKNEPKVE